jgi:Flp pilus assembly pilin Flp
MSHYLRAFVHQVSDESGVTVIEYAVMLVLVAVAVILGSFDFQSGLSMLYGGVASFISTAAAALP